jgi:hypothetical protein
MLDYDKRTLLIPIDGALLIPPNERVRSTDAVSKAIKATTSTFIFFYFENTKMTRIKEEMM